MERFRNRGNLRGIVTVSLECLLIAGALLLAAAAFSWWLYPLIVLVIGTRQYALTEVLAHEAAHRNLCAWRPLNDGLGMLMSWPLFQTFEGYRRFHLEHHRVPLGDEDNNIREEYAFWGLPEDDEPLGRRRAFWLLVARPALGLMAVYHLLAVLSDAWYDRDLKENTLMLALWGLGLLLAWQAGLLLELLLFWVVPALTVMATLNYWSEVGDHYRVHGAETRSDLNPLLNRLVSHNIGYHALHHRDPKIPWYLLPEAYAAHNRELREEISQGYRETFRQIVAA